MCGIVGCVGISDAARLVFAGLERVEYRGYDSAGIGVRSETGIHIARTEGRISNLDVENLADLGTTCAIGHTRWATHGEPSSINAHPHQGCDARVAIVHNGVLENHQGLRRELQAGGHRFVSETDTEVIAHLFERALEGVRLPRDPRERPATLAAVAVEILPRLNGANAVLAMFSDAPELVAMRTGSGGGLGVGAAPAGGYLIASDRAAWISRMTEITFLDPGEVGVVSPERVTFFDALGDCVDGPRRTTAVPKAPPVDIDRPQSAVLLQEILEQPSALRQEVEGRVRRSSGEVDLEGVDFVSPQVEDLFKSWPFVRMVLCACGTPWNACLVGRHFFERLASIPTQVECAHEYVSGAELTLAGTLFVAVSQSGETADVLLALEKARRAGATTMVVTNVPGSAATRLSDVTWELRCGPEFSVAQTKAFTSELLALLLIAFHAAIARGSIGSADAGRLAAAISAVPEQALWVIEAAQLVCDRIAGTYVDEQSFLFLGRGLNHPIANEGALKLKELSYAHAEGYPAAEMKHGPIALIRSGYPVIAVAPRDGVHARMLNGIEQVRARGARVLAVGSPEDAQLAAACDDLFEVPDVLDLVSPILNVIPLQLFAYSIAMMRGHDVDRPRNLAKSVTVE